MLDWSSIRELPWRKTKGSRTGHGTNCRISNFRFYFASIIDRRIMPRYSNSKVNFIALQRVSDHASKSRSNRSTSRLRYLLSKSWTRSYVTREMMRRVTSTISLLDIDICDLKRLSSSHGAEIKGETSRVAYFSSSRNRIWSREFWFDCREFRSDRCVIWSESQMEKDHYKFHFESRPWRESIWILLNLDPFESIRKAIVSFLVMYRWRILIKNTLYEIWRHFVYILERERESDNLNWYFKCSMN